MIAPYDTTDYLGLSPSDTLMVPVGMKGYDKLHFAEPDPASQILLGDVSPTDVGLIETLTSDAQQAFESTQPSAVAAATYGGGTSGVIPPGVNAGSISFLMASLWLPSSERR